MSALTDALAALSPLLRRQHGLVTPAQALACRVTAQQMARLVDAGVLERRGRGLYAVVTQPDSWEHRALGGLLSVGQPAALSHWAAAKLLGLEHARAGRAPSVEVTVPRGRRPRSLAGVVVHTSHHLDPERDVSEVGAFRVTSAPWTIAALCARFDLGRAERLVDAAVANGATTRRDLEALVERWWHTPGVVMLRAVLLRQVEQVRGTRSEAERRFLRIVRGADLPLPEPDVRVVDAAGRVRYLDFAYRELRIAIEIDVYPEHARTLGRNRDGERQNDLVPTWLPLRFDADDLARPGLVADQVRRALVAVGALAA